MPAEPDEANLTTNQKACMAAGRSVRAANAAKVGLSAITDIPPANATLDSALLDLDAAFLANDGA